MLIIILMVIFVVYWCLSTKIVQTKQTHLVRAFFTKVSTVTHNYEKIKKGIVRGWSTLRDPICCIFFLCVPFLKDCLFLISSWDTGTSRAACSSQDWDHGKEHLLGFPSSDSLQWLSSVTLYLLDYPCNWWNFILFNGWVIILLKIYKHAFLISMLIKYPCSTRDLSPLHPSFYLQLLLQSMETYWAHFLTQAFKTSLRGHPVPSWVVQVLCMGFIGFPHNPRDIALSVFFSLSLGWLQSPGPGL